MNERHFSFKSSEVHGKLPSENGKDLEWLQLLALAPFLFPSEHNTFGGSQVEPETRQVPLITGWRDMDSDFCSAGEQTRPAPSGFSLRVWADGDRAVTPGAIRRLMVSTSIPSPFFFLHGLDFYGWDVPCYCGLKCFWGDFLGKVLHTQGELQNQQYPGKRKVIYLRAQ